MLSRSTLFRDALLSRNTQPTWKTVRRLSGGTKATGIYEVENTKTGVKAIMKPLETAGKYNATELNVYQRLPTSGPFLKLLDHTTTHIYLQYMSGGDLFEYQEKHNIDMFERKSLFRQMAEAVYELHKVNILHRDIKLEQYLLTGEIIDGCPQLVLSDFDLSVSHFTELVSDGLGTPSYVAPEVIRRVPYGKSVDVWSLGVCFHALTYGCFPFDVPSGINEDEAYDILYRSILRSQPTITNCIVEKNLTDLLSRMLDKNPATRITIEEVLKHPYFKQRSVKKMRK